MTDSAPSSAAAPAASIWQRGAKVLVGLGVIAVVVLLVRQLGPSLAPQVTAFLSWVDGLGMWAPVVYIAGYALATVAFIPGSLLTMAGGVLFGIGQGTVVVFLGATLGATLAFLVARYLARGMIEAKLEGNDRFRLIDRAIEGDGLRLVFLLRLVPFFPFIWLNYGLGLTRVRLRDYVLGSLGMLPGTLLYVYYGKAIGSLAALAQGQSVERGAEQYAILVLGLLAAIAVTTLITRRARRALAEATQAASVEESSGSELASSTEVAS